MMTLKSVCHSSQVSNICLITQEIRQCCRRQGARPENQPRRDDQLRDWQFHHINEILYRQKINDISYQEAFSQGQRAYHPIHFADLESWNSR